jgi:hypothetical protein
LLCPSIPKQRTHVRDENLATLSTRKETLLVICEFLARSYEDWRKHGEEAEGSLSDDSFVLSKPDSRERVALWRLEGEIERTLPEMFAPDYLEPIKGEKQRLSAKLYGS